MPNRHLIRSQLFPYHVVNRCNNREWFQLPLEVVWDVIAREVYRLSLLYGAQTHAFVLMSNHYHWLVSTPEADLGKVMAEFGRSVTRSFNRLSGRSGHLFQGRYRASIIQSPLYYAYALKYVYRNPVRAEIVAAVEDYPYSTLFGVLGRSVLPFPLYYPNPELQGISFLPYEIAALVEWFNVPFQNELEAAITKGVQMHTFELPLGVL